MKLKELLKGYEEQKNIKVTDGFNTMHADGKSMKHYLLVNADYRDWLDKEVLNTTKHQSCDGGMVVIHI